VREGNQGTSWHRLTTARVHSFLLATYRGWRLYIAPERLRMRKVCREWIRHVPPGGFVLEIGGGTAFLKDTIANEVADVRYVSGDISPTNVTGIVLDATALPMASNVADAVLALEVLEHIERPEAMIGEVARVLRSGAIAIITMPFMFGVHDFRDYQRYTPLGFATLLARHGLELVETRQRGGTFVASAGLVRTLLQSAIIGQPADWRAQGRSRKVRWLIATVVMTPWSLITWTAVGLDQVLDRSSKSPPGYFFLVRKSAGSPSSRRYSA
jgi:SAM-dependent methyltransferase